MPRTADPFDISLVKIPEVANNSGAEMEMVDAVDQFDISELHIPKTKAMVRARVIKRRKLLNKNTSL